MSQRIAGFAGLLVLAACSPETAKAPDLIITNAKVFTADPDKPWAEAVAVSGTTISAVGDSAAVLAMAGEGTRKVDAGGRLLVPGLTDAHVHLGAYGKACQQLPPVNLPYPGPTAQEALDAVKAAAGSGAGWICGTIGPIVVEDTRNWRAALDAVSPERPVVLQASWGHPSILNSAALRAINVDDAAPNPAGGWFERDAAGKLTGVARESAETLVYRALSKDLDPADNVDAANAMIESYFGWGITSVHLMASGPELGKTLATLAAARPDMSWTVYGWGYPTSPLDQIWTDVAAATPPANARLAGVKWILDGTPIERGAFMSVDYADEPGWRGRSNFADADLDALLTAALEKPGQVAFHAVGDAEIERLLTAMEAKAPAETWRGKRVRIEHGDGMTASLRNRAAALSVTVIQNPLHLDPSPMNPSPTAPTGTRFAPERIADQFALKSLRADGVPLALGSDAGGDGLNPWLNLMLATINPLNPAQALSREEALAAYTSGGAWAEQAEARRGIIREGLEADMALLSQDVLSVPPPQLPATRSLLTVADGKVVHEEAL